MPLNFAAETEVTPENSRAEIERLLKKVGAKRFGFVVDEGEAQIAFEVGDRRYRFRVEVPALNHPYVRQLPQGGARDLRYQPAARERLERMRWRTLVLGIKARLAEVEVGVATFADVFLPHTILPSGRTVAEETAEPIRLAYQGRSVPLLPGA